jgi:hypothetical protein
MAAVSDAAGVSLFHQSSGHNDASGSLLNPSAAMRELYTSMQFDRDKVSVAPTITLDDFVKVVEVEGPRYSVHKRGSHHVEPPQGIMPMAQDSNFLHSKLPNFGFQNDPQKSKSLKRNLQRGQLREGQTSISV